MAKSGGFWWPPMAACSRSIRGSNPHRHHHRKIHFLSSYSLEGSYQLSYNREISGHISENKLTDLRGVSFKIFFLWLNIIEVRRFGDHLQFSVGIASADFPIDHFLDFPQCGCSFDCDDFGMRAPQVSSV